MANRYKLSRVLLTILVGVLALHVVAHSAEGNMPGQQMSATLISLPTPLLQQGQDPLGVWEEITMPLKSAFYTAAFASPEDGWAFGGYDPARWDGQTWAEYAQLKDLQWVNAVKLLSADNGWAVGKRGMIFHWDGHLWKRESAPTYDNDMLVGVDFTSPRQGWAIGIAGFDRPHAQGLLLEWNGINWIRLQDGARDPLTAIDIQSSTEGWIAGSETQLFHWNGKQWQLIESPSQKGVLFNSISIVGPNDAWMVGNTNSNEGEIWHWNGSQWSKFQDTQLGLFSVSMASADFGWAVGGYRGFGGNASGSLLLHWDGTKWAEYPISTTTPLQFVWASTGSDGWIFGGGPTLYIDGEYPGVAFRYRIVTATSVPSATASSTPSPTSTNTKTLPATATPVPSQTLLPSSTPAIATSTPTLSPPASKAAQSLPLWAVLAALLVLAVGGILFAVYLRRRR